MGAIPTWLWPYSGGGGKDFPIHHNPSYWNDDPDILGTGLKAQPVFQFWKWSSSHVISSVSFRPNSSNKANKKYVLELPSE